MENDIQRSLGRIEGKVESLISDLQELRGASLGHIAGLDLRLNTVEKKQYGVFLIAGVAFTSLVAVVKKFWN